MHITDEKILCNTFTRKRISNPIFERKPSNYETNRSWKKGTRLLSKNYKLTITLSVVIKIIFGLVKNFQNLIFPDLYDLSPKIKKPTFLMHVCVYVTHFSK